MKTSVKIILGLVSVLLVACVAGVVLIYIQTSKTQEQFAPLLESCRGNTVSQAAAYTDTPGNHPAMGVMKSKLGLRIYTYIVPDEVLAASVAEAQLVLCATEAEEVLIERCPYATKNEKGAEATNVVERYYYQQEVKLVEAKTGRTIASETLRGKDPRECLKQETFLKGQETVKVKGQEISSRDLQEWIRPYVIK